MSISAGVLVISNGQILLVQQNYDQEGSNLSIPKGHVNQGEGCMECALRELYEETGLQLEKHNLAIRPHVIIYELKGIKRTIIYYLAHINYDRHELYPIDQNEILRARFYNYEEAEGNLQLMQLPVLIHMKHYKLPARYLDWLINSNYIKAKKHHVSDLWIIDYTDKCKSDKLWNEITMWCRGLIVDVYNNIVQRPLKKFFEPDELTQGVNISNSYTVYEKIDGAFGIIYWLEDLPHFATRSSFNSTPAIAAETILYTKYYDLIQLLDKKLTYFFEIVNPWFVNIVDYGETNDIFLLGAFDNKSMREVPLEELEKLTFSRPVRAGDNISIDSLLSRNISGQEGYVLRYDDGFRIKIKFEDYKKSYFEKYHKKD